MGGAPCCEGNVTPAGEYKFIRRMGTEIGNFAVECNSTAREAYRAQTGEDGISLPDPVAMSIALDPSIGCESSHHYVDVETASDLTRGMTVVDRLGVAADDGIARLGQGSLSEAPTPKSIGQSMRRAGSRRCTQL
jgi:purine nucleosidase